MLEDGLYPSRAALARGEGVSRAAVTQALSRTGNDEMVLFQKRLESQTAEEAAPSEGEK